MGDKYQRYVSGSAYAGTHVTDRRQLRPNYYYRPGQTLGQSAAATAQSVANRRIIQAIVMAAVAGVLCLTIPHALKRSPTTAASDDPQTASAGTAAAQDQTAALPVKQTTSDETMAAAINEAIASHSSVETSVTIVDINHNKTYHYGLPDNIVYVAASVGKVLTATYYLHLTEDGTRSLTQKVGGQTALDQITVMIEKSDNEAWDALNKSLTWKKLGEYATSIGISHYDPADNTLTTGDIALLFTKIQQGQLLNKSNNDLLLQKLKNANRTDFIKAAAPDTAAVYHKAGWLDDRSHDAAIIDDGRDPYVLVIFTKGAGAGEKGRIDIIHRVTKATVDRFIGTTAATDSGA